MCKICFDWYFFVKIKRFPLKEQKNRLFKYVLKSLKGGKKINREICISKREKIFCYYYVNGKSVKEAAFRAGYIIAPEKNGLSLLMKDEISNFISEMYKRKKKNFLERAYCGYERLAFGSTEDIIKLVCNPNFSEEDLSGLDFFNVSEIKRNRDGGLEVKFFDRLKALEKLENIVYNNEDQGLSFYNALEKSAEKLKFSDGK